LSEFSATYCSRKNFTTILKTIYLVLAKGDDYGWVGDRGSGGKYP